jgi:hypothetical protein
VRNKINIVEINEVFGGKARANLHQLIQLLHVLLCSYICLCSVRTLHQDSRCPSQVLRLLFRSHSIPSPSNLEVRIHKVNITQNLVLDSKRMIDLPSDPVFSLVYFGQLTSNSDHSPPATKYVFHHFSGIVLFSDETKKFSNIDFRGFRW